MMVLSASNKCVEKERGLEIPGHYSFINDSARSLGGILGCSDMSG